MRWAYELAAQLPAELPVLGRNADAGALDLFREVLRFRELAQSCAKDTAPYCHPRLATIAGPEGDPIKLDAIEVSGLRTDSRSRPFSHPPCSRLRRRQMSLHSRSWRSVPLPHRASHHPSVASSARAAFMCARPLHRSVRPASGREHRIRDGCAGNTNATTTAWGHLR